MKVILIGANGTIGELVQKALAGAGHEIVKVGHKSGDLQVEIESRERVSKLYQAVGSFDAVAIAAGQVAFAPLSELTAEKWQFSLGSKLLGQIKSGSGGDPVHQRKRILHLGFGHWFRAFSMTTRSSPASRAQPSRARWKLLFGLPQLSFPRDFVSMW